MDALVNWLSSVYIGHPLVQTITHYIGIILRAGFLLLGLSGCLFLAFAKFRRYHFPKGSVSERCWQVSWFLLMGELLFLTSRIYHGQRTMSNGEIVSMFVPYVVLVSALVPAARYYKRVGAALQKAERNHQ